MTRSRDLAVDREGPVSFQRASANNKIAMVELFTYDPESRFKRPIPVPPFVCSTYVSIEATCPVTCRFKGAGCFVQSGITGKRARGLDEAADAAGMNGDDVNELEAAVIDRQWPRGVPQDGYRGRGRDLRLHVGGDVASARGAQVLGAAAERWRARGGGAVWTYTHRWAEVPRSAWGDAIRVLASVESLAEAEEATALGYAPGFTMANFASERRWVPRGSEIGILPCPAQTRDRTCVECRICLDAPLPGPWAVAFAMHGRSAASGRRRLPVWAAGLAVGGQSARSERLRAPVMLEQVDEQRAAAEFDAGIDAAGAAIEQLRERDIGDTRAVIQAALDAMGLDWE